MNINFSDPRIVAGIIAAITSIITIFLIKPFVDKRLHLFKLRADFKADQQKKIKIVLAKYKVHLIKSCETLNHRFWNFSENHSKGWHNVDNDFTKRSYYLDSFAYRILSIFAWIKLIEKELIFLDTTISDKNDIDMIKYFRLFSECFCDLILFDNHNYESSVATDHFFRNQFENLSNNLIYNNDVITFDEYIKYLTNHITDVKAIYQFLDGINPVENRLRWNRLQIFHIVIMSFLNSYGYDFQYTNSKKMKIITKNIGGFKLIGNFENLIIRDGFARNKELKKIIKVIRS